MGSGAPSVLLAYGEPLRGGRPTGVQPGKDEFEPGPDAYLGLLDTQFPPELGGEIGKVHCLLSRLGGCHNLRFAQDDRATEGCFLLDQEIAAELRMKTVRFWSRFHELLTDGAVVADETERPKAATG